MVVRVAGRRRVVLVAAAVLLAVLVVAIAVFQVAGTRSSASDSPAVAPARPAPILGEREAAGDGSAMVAPGTRPSDGQRTDVPVGGVERELVRTAELSLEVADPAGAVRQARTAVAAAGGIVAEEQTDDAGSRLVLRVPSEALDRLIDDLAALGHVSARSGQVLDVTEDVVDLDARVATQTASVARVRGLLAEAETIGDVIAIESELSRREADLASLTNRLDALRDQVALSTLTLDLRGPGVVAPVEPSAPGFLDGLANGWDGLRAVGSAAAAVVGFVLPFLPVLAVMGGIAWTARRMVRARRMPAAAGGRSGPGSEGES